MHFAPGGLVEELSDALTASFRLLSTVFFPTHPPTHTRTTNISLSCGWWSVKSHLSSWKRTGSTKFPFLHMEPLRHGTEWQSMARHIWSSPQTNRQCICMAPRRLPRVNSVALPQPLSDCIMTPNRALTWFIFPLLWLWTQQIDNALCRSAQSYRCLDWDDSYI